MARRKSARVSVEKAQTPTEEFVQNKIALDELIPVMSLIDNRLNLMPQNNFGGRAKYLFERFGDKKQIIYQDILTIVENYKHFMEAGYFLILDKRVIDRHGLQEMYSKILNREQIEKILTGSSEALSLYKNCSKEQQRLIVGMLTRKLSEHPDSVDLNVIDKISQISGVKITENANEMRENFSRRKDKEESE